jgi:hypothetical protein
VMDRDLGVCSGGCPCVVEKPKEQWWNNHTSCPHLRAARPIFAYF